MGISELVVFKMQTTFSSDIELVLCLISAASVDD